MWKKAALKSQQQLHIEHEVVFSETGLEPTKAAGHENCRNHLLEVLTML